MTMLTSAFHHLSLARLTFGEPVSGLPETELSYTPPQPRRSYQEGLIRLERHRRARMEAAAAAEDWETHDRWQQAPMLPALLIGVPDQSPKTVPSLLTELLWGYDSVVARVTAATPKGDLLPEDVILLRLQAGQVVASVPVIYDR